ncbi:MAG TPA: bifunctional DNA-binding transcriptional regulator/O6-methylguanine-DNA methyltransferase Ada [Terriglobia bacterium]|nr:bifunctional DNA-binding transcriptional regulator/O6-methylguanine-DNA methyltransferase Ada [Terriglobia bacterium]
MRTTQPVSSQSAASRQPDEDRRWRAVETRDPSFDGEFVYAVRSTGIYCRPWCPSRRPRRGQVVFYPASGDAERAGYRPCRRCQPGALSPRRLQNGLIARVCRMIEENLASLDGAPTLEALSAEAGLSPHHLQRTFKRVMGVTPRQYAESRRVDGLKSGLKNGKDVTRALYDAGYGSASRLYERAGVQLGMTPATYRRGGQGMRIRYVIVDCRLGRLLVAATERGVSAVSLGALDAPLEAALRAEYPHAEIERERRAEGGLAAWMQSLLDHLEGELPSLDLPVDIQATAFQSRVWRELCAIPYGSTRSYGDIARAIGRPSAVRAVARAVAANPVAVVIPCHRVVHRDGSLSGYRWGPERKRTLLETERQARGSPSKRRAAGGP